MKRKSTTGESKIKDKKAEELSFTFGSTPEEFADILSISSLLFGAISILFKYRVFAWGALVTGVMSIANMRTADTDLKSLTTSLLVSIMSLVLAYFGPSANQFS